MHDNTSCCIHHTAAAEWLTRKEKKTLVMLSPRKKQATLFSDSYGGAREKQEAQLSRRDARDALYQLKCCSTVVRITQTNRLLAWAALSTTDTFYSATCIVQLSHSEQGVPLYNQPCWLSHCPSEDYPYSSSSTGSVLIWTFSNLTSNTESGYRYLWIIGK